MDYLKQFINIKETLDILYTILIYNKSVLQILNDINEQKLKAKNITNVVKKNKINERLYLFENYLNDNFLDQIEKINCIFLINDSIYRFDLTSEMIKVANEYNMRNYFIKVDTFFHVEYLIDFFTNFYFIYNIKFNKNEIILTKINKSKDKEIYSNKSITENDFVELCNKIKNDYNYKENIFITGNSNMFTKINNIKNIIIKNGNYSRNEVWEFYEIELMERIQKFNLAEQMRYISKPFKLIPY
jgi:hypothetical protein